ncbi:MAG: 30S ribosomal protein S2 [Mycoplasmataceae bacterium]|nr:30S ribosomal protein S2 [Mycoplasmataceae bacterium]
MNNNQDFTAIDLFTKKLYEQAGVPHLISSEKLDEVGAQNLVIGRKWNPKNTIYLSSKSANGSKFFDLRRIIYAITTSYKALQDAAINLEDILFVATKNTEISSFVKQQCEINGLFYVTKRWLGGILTNFKTIKQSINKLNRLIELQASGEIKKYSKKEQIQLAKECNKLNGFIGGIKNMTRPPRVVVVLDSVNEKNAIAEAKKVNATIIALSNSDANPKDVDYNIPCNTKSKRTCWLILAVLFDAISSIKKNPILVVGKKDSDIVVPLSTNK